jgi:uncharacterized protein (TIGR00369 family)
VNAEETFEQRVRESFARQSFMSTLGAHITHVEAGAVEIELPYDPRLTQQNGFLHAGAVAAVLDSACGYAAHTLMDSGVDVLTVEYKIDLLRPASGDRVLARGRVLRSGRTLTVCRGEAVVVGAGEERLIASMASTLIAVARGPDVERTTA